MITQSKLRAVFELLDLSNAEIAKLEKKTMADHRHLIDQILIQGIAEEAAVLNAWATISDTEVLNNPDNILVEETPFAALGPRYCAKHLILPISHIGDELTVATSRPWANDLIQEVGFLLDFSVKPVGMPSQAIRATLEAISRANATEDTFSNAPDEDVLRMAAQEGPVAKAVADAIDDAVAIGASDLHFEVSAGQIRLRTRLHGTLQKRAFDRTLDPRAVLARIKVLAGMNVTETRLPQDGRIQLVTSGRKIDLRVSSVPTSHGESIVCRILDPKSLQKGWSDLGFDTKTATQIKSLIEQPNGLFLVTGPTGSGKTTTLYTALRHLNSEGRKILTIEDPIEYELAGVEQVQVHEEIGMTFATAVRSFLRQDPNVIMVGEIRDQETAEMACRAALIGRMVLSTLHTNSAEGAITRMRDLGVQDYILNDVLRGVLSQRLEANPSKQKLQYELKDLKNVARS